MKKLERPSTYDERGSIYIHGLDIESSSGTYHIPGISFIDDCPQPDVEFYYEGHRYRHYFKWDCERSEEAAGFSAWLKQVIDYEEELYHIEAMGNDPACTHIDIRQKDPAKVFIFSVPEHGEVCSAILEYYYYGEGNIGCGISLFALSEDIHCFIKPFSGDGDPYRNQPTRTFSHA